jgi:hypothetical protein
MNDAIALRFAAIAMNAVKILWAATPRIRRRSGSSRAPWAPSLRLLLSPSTLFRRVLYRACHSGEP